MKPLLDTFLEESGAGEVQYASGKLKKQGNGEGTEKITRVCTLAWGLRGGNQLPLCFLPFFKPLHIYTFQNFS